MTDNEIIKALNYCCGNIGYNDEECNKDMCYQVALPENRDGDIRWCKQWLIKDAIDLINRQKELINGLIAGQETLQKHLTDKQGQIEKFEKIEHFATKTIDTQHAEIDRLNIELQSMRSAANSYKMHYETAKSEAIKEFAERLKENYCFTDRWGKIIPISTVDNIVKEMTEVSE